VVLSPPTIKVESGATATAHGKQLGVSEKVGFLFLFFAYLLLWTAQNEESKVQQKRNLLFNFTQAAKLHKQAHVCFFFFFTFLDLFSSEAYCRILNRWKCYDKMAELYDFQLLKNDRRRAFREFKQKDDRKLQLQVVATASQSSSGQVPDKESSLGLPKQETGLLPLSSRLETAMRNSAPKQVQLNNVLLSEKKPKKPSGLSESSKSLPRRNSVLHFF
jgi:hypothetical protein